ncbi:hypothetical protein DWB77_00413 [Streptomyces hundungensis]|uniref:Uncharacterized protein n=1 Tax=Streptomyces hundungensis TaxID=1077946 RepID=A0A387H3P9_9ACTN|nr:hypothetical protein [Streptomyces hundungensis]AYG78306.1 hypothetical protein DWB77_00413 [Streptomyces hundungensis]
MQVSPHEREWLGQRLAVRLIPEVAQGRTEHGQQLSGRHGAARQAVVVLVHAVTAPRTSWRIMRAPATETRAPTPVRDPDWVANRTHHDKGGTA